MSFGKALSNVRQRENELRDNLLDELCNKLTSKMSSISEDQGCPLPRELEVVAPNPSSIVIHHLPTEWWGERLGLKTVVAGSNEGTVFADIRELVTTTTKTTASVKVVFY
jgi:hypothetical protein